MRKPNTLFVLGLTSALLLLVVLCGADLDDLGGPVSESGGAISTHDFGSDRAVDGSTGGDASSSADSEDSTSLSDDRDSSEDPNASDDSQSGTLESQTSGPEDESTPVKVVDPEVGSAGTRDEPLAVGRAARVGDWEVTVMAVDTEANAVVIGEDGGSASPGDGATYVLVTMIGKYVGDGSGEFLNDISYRLMVSNDDSLAPVATVDPYPVAGPEEGSTGSVVESDNVFEVPVDMLEGSMMAVETSDSDGSPGLVFWSLQ